MQGVNTNYYAGNPLRGWLTIVIRMYYHLPTASIYVVEDGNMAIGFHAWKMVADMTTNNHFVNRYAREYSFHKRLRSLNLCQSKD